MASSNSILDFFDEYMKHEYLNMCIYSFYNLLDFVKEVASTDYIPLKEDWYALRDNVSMLRQRLLDKYDVLFPIMSLNIGVINIRIQGGTGKLFLLGADGSSVSGTHNLFGHVSYTV